MLVFDEREQKSANVLGWGRRHAVTQGYLKQGDAKCCVGDE
jgi:hypothetical protein